VSKEEIKTMQNAFVTTGAIAFIVVDLLIKIPGVEETSDLATNSRARVAASR
jgi:hypothetical protein